MMSAVSLNRRASGWALGLLLLTRLVLGLTYSQIIPPWEAYDEEGHFAYARYIAHYRSLLKPGDPEAEAVWEKFQPPVYYLLVAPFIMGFDLAPTFQVPPHNPYLANGNAGVNFALVSDAPTGLTYQTELALRIARVVSVLVTTLSVFFIYWAARLLWPKETSTAWAMTLVYAFWPQFLFIGSVTTNDALATTWAAVIFYLTVRLALRPLQWQTVLGLGVATGLAMLTKINTLSLLPSAALALVISAAPYLRQNQLWRSPRLWLMLFALGLSLIAALLGLSSNKFVTEQVFRAETVQRFLDNLTLPNTLEFIGDGLKYAFRTFWASFGWGNLEGPVWLYNVWAISAALAGLGGVVGLRRIDRRTLWLNLIILAFPVCILSLTLALALSYQNLLLLPGRYLLIGLPAVSYLLVAGWRNLLPQTARHWAWKLIGVGLIGIGWALPLTSIHPAYAKPRPLTGEIDHPLAFIYADQIELLGYMQSAPIAPGETVRLRLCWQARTALTKNYSVQLNVVGPDQQGYGNLITYPGRGNYATSFWTPNQPFCDNYDVPVGSDIPAPAQAWVRVNLIDDALGHALPVQNAERTAPPNYDVQVPFKVKPPTNAPKLANPVTYQFGSSLKLIGYEVSPLTGSPPGARVRLQWQALDDLHTDYHVFVHLRDTPATAYVQADHAPRNGSYPTYLWEKGEIITDEYEFIFPSAEPPPLALYIGLTQMDTNTRVSVLDVNNQTVPNGEVILVEGLTFKFSSEP